MRSKIYHPEQPRDTVSRPGGAPSTPVIYHPDFISHLIEMENLQSLGKRGVAHLDMPRRIDKCSAAIRDVSGLTAAKDQATPATDARFILAFGTQSKSRECLIRSALSECVARPVITFSLEKIMACLPELKEQLRTSVLSADATASKVEGQYLWFRRAFSNEMIEDLLWEAVEREFHVVIEVSDLDRQDWLRTFISGLQPDIYRTVIVWAFPEAKIVQSRQINSAVLNMYKRCAELYRALSRDVADVICVTHDGGPNTRTLLHTRKTTMAIDSSADRSLVSGCMTGLGDKCVRPSIFQPLLLDICEETVAAVATTTTPEKEPIAAATTTTAPTEPETPSTFAAQIERKTLEVKEEPKQEETSSKAREHKVEKPAKEEQVVEHAPASALVDKDKEALRREWMLAMTPKRSTADAISISGASMRKKPRVPSRGTIKGPEWDARV